MLDSAKDVGIEGSKLLDVAGDYVHNEHHYHYQNPESFSVFFPSDETFHLESSDPGHNLHANIPSLTRVILRFDGSGRGISLINYEKRCLRKGPLTSLQLRSQESQKKGGAKVPQSPSTADRTQTEHRKPFVRPPVRRFRSWAEMRRAAYGTSPPSNVIYSTDPANVKRSNDHEPDADKEKAEDTPEPDNIPFPLNSYTSPDFDVYDELYQNPSDADTDWESHPDPDYSDYSNFEEPPTSLPPLPPPEVDVEYWHAYNAWCAWYAHCIASWQASMAAWSVALMSWTPPWLGMCAPSWLGAWAPWR